MLGAVTRMRSGFCSKSCAHAMPNALVFPRPRSAVNTKGRLRCPVTTFSIKETASVCSLNWCALSAWMKAGNGGKDKFSSITVSCCHCVCSHSPASSTSWFLLATTINSPPPTSAPRAEVKLLASSSFLASNSKTSHSRPSNILPCFAFTQWAFSSCHSPTQNQV